MVKNLRYVLMSMLVMLGMSAMAEDIIWQEDWTGCAANAVPFDVNPTYSSEGTGTKIYDANLAGGTAPELLIAKNNGSFIVTIQFNGKHGDMVLSYMANYDRITVNVLQGAGITLGEKTASGNSYSIPMTVPEGSFDVTLQFQNTTSSNVRFDNAKLYQGTAKKPAGLSWGTASRTVTIGSDENVFPTLSNEQNLSVVFASDSTNVATIDQNGVITLVAAGSTNISASFAGNDEYEAQTVSYKLTVKAASGGGGDDPNPQPVGNSVSVAQALTIIAGLDNGAKTADDYTVKGYVVKVTDISAQYGNATFTIADAAGDSTNVLTIFRAKGFNGENITDENLLKAGDLVEVQGKLQKYVNKDSIMTPELTGGKIVSINGNTGGGDDPNPQPVGEKVTVAEALTIIAGLNNGAKTDDDYIVKGYVIKVTEISTQYGNATFTIADAAGDSTNVLTVYRAKNAVGENITDENLLKAGDLVEVQGKLQKYVSKDSIMTPEVAQNGKILTVNGQATGISEFKSEKRFDGAIYNLKGQRISVPARGLFIRNGRKFFVK